MGMIEKFKETFGAKEGRDEYMDEQEEFVDDGGTSPADINYASGYEPQIPKSGGIIEFQTTDSISYKLVKITDKNYIDKQEEAANYYKSGCRILLNMDEASKTASDTVLNFLGGVAFGLDGDLTRMSLNSYVVSIKGDEINGDIYKDSSAQRNHKSPREDYSFSEEFL